MKIEEDNATDYLADIEMCLSGEKAYVIDYFPERIKDVETFEKIETYLLKKKNRKKYAERITNILLKLMPYFEVKIFIPETSVDKLKEYEGMFLYDEMNISKLKHILKKIIIKDGTVTVLLKPENIVISIGLYNTAAYFEEFREIPLLEKIVASEGLFFWKG